MNHSEEILRANWPDLLAKGLIRPADPSGLAPETKDADGVPWRPKSAERLFRLADGRVISYVKRRTEHGECMSRWAQECCRHYQLHELEVLLVHPEILCQECSQRMGVRWVETSADETAHRKFDLGGESS